MTPSTKADNRPAADAAANQGGTRRKAPAKAAARPAAAPAKCKTPARRTAPATREAAAGTAARRATARGARASGAPATGATHAVAPAAAAAPSLVAAVVTAALDDLKAQNVVVLDVRRLTDVTDTIVLASGTSDRHVKSLAWRVVERAKEAGFRPYGVEGQQDGEWVLVDLQDLVVHVMLPRVREFYGLEKLWDPRAAEQRAAV